MTEAIEGRSSITTTMTIDSKNGGPGSPAGRVSKTSFKEDFYSTFSSPLAWILVLALIITWSCVFVIMFDLVDYNTLSGGTHPGNRKVWKDSAHRGGLSKITPDEHNLVNDIVEESTNVITSLFKFAGNLIAPEEDEGNLYAVRKKGEFLPSKSKVLGMQVAEVEEEEETVSKKEAETEEEGEDEMQIEEAIIDEEDPLTEDEDDEEGENISKSVSARAEIGDEDVLKVETGKRKRKTLISDKDFEEKSDEEPVADDDDDDDDELSPEHEDEELFLSAGSETDALVDVKDNKDALTLSEEEADETYDDEYDEDKSSDEAFAVASDDGESSSILDEDEEEDDDGDDSLVAISDSDYDIAEDSDNVLGSDLPPDAIASEDEEDDHEISSEDEEDDHEIASEDEEDDHEIASEDEEDDHEHAQKEDIFPLFDDQVYDEDLKLKAVDDNLEDDDLHRLQEEMSIASSEHFADDEDEEEDFKDNDLIDEDILSTFKNAEIRDYKDKSFDLSEDEFHDFGIKEVEEKDKTDDEDVDKTLLEFTFVEEDKTEITELDINEDRYEFKDEVTESSADEDDGVFEDYHHGLDDIMLTGTSHSAAPEEEEEEEDETEEVVTPPLKSVDESDDKKEEFDEDDQKEKTRVHRIKPKVPKIKPTVCSCMHAAETKEFTTRTKDTKVTPRRVSAVRRKKEHEALKTGEKPKKQALPRITGLNPKVMKSKRIVPLFKAKIHEKTKKSKTSKTEEEHEQEEESSQEVQPCRPAPVYCPSPPGWYVHHIVTDNPYPPPTVPVSSAPVLTIHPGVPSEQPPYQQQQTPPPVQPLYAHHQTYQMPAMPPPQEPAQPVQPIQQQEQGPLVPPEIPSPAVEDQPNAAEVQEPNKKNQRTRFPAMPKKVSAVKSEGRVSKDKTDPDPERHPQRITLRTRLETGKKGNATSKAKEEKPTRSSSSPPANTRTKSVSQKKKEPKSEDEISKNKKSGQRYFQCIYYPGKKAQYPLQPFTPAMSSAMLSPAVKVMLDQQKAAKASEQ